MVFCAALNYDIRRVLLLFGLGSRRAVLACGGSRFRFFLDAVFFIIEFVLEFFTRRVAVIYLALAAQQVGIADEFVAVYRSLIQHRFLIQKLFAAADCLGNI